MSIVDNAKAKASAKVTGAMQAVMGTAVGLMPDAPPDPMRSKGGVIGAQVSRVDGPVKVAGQARFAAEVALDGMCYATLVTSTVARGRIVELDTAAAEAASGVVLIMTYRNAPKMKAPTRFTESLTAATNSNLTVMQDDVVHYDGEPVAVVLADTQEQADHAASLIRIAYEREPAVLDFDAVKHEAVPPPIIFTSPPEVKHGDAETALASAPVSVDLTYRTPRHSHAAIEPHALTTAWNDDGSLVVHTCSQMLGGTRGNLAEVFGLKEKHIRILSPFVGGGFGGKTLWSHEYVAIAAARLASRPVRLALSREQVFRLTGFRTVTEQRMALGAREDGQLLALIHDGLTASVYHNAFPEQISFPARHMYAAENLLVGQKKVDLDTAANTSMRAPGESVATFAIESAMDELAEKLGMDPIELRVVNDPDKDPESGKPFSSRHAVEAWRNGADAFGWSKRNAVPRARREGEWLIGMGCASGTYPFQQMPGGVARIRLSADGRAVVQMASHEMGMGTATVQAQHAAARLGLPFEDVTFEYGDTDLPAGTMAGGSSQTASIIATVAAASDELFREVIRLAGNDSPLAGLKADEVEADGGGLRGREDPARFETYASILTRAGRDIIEAEGKSPMPTAPMKYSMHSFSAVFCEVRVNDVTGETRVSRLLGSFDCGRILNAKTAASQFRGGMIQGLGLALTEELLFDTRSGRFMNPSMAEYHVPVHLDVPEIDVIWTDIPDPHSPMGARGVGEIGITGVGAAVANAIYNACGVRIRDLPLTLDKVLAGLSHSADQGR